MSEEVEVAGVKSSDEQIAERMNKQGWIDLCSPTKALKNNNDTTIIDNTTATDDDEMKRLRVIVVVKNTEISALNQVDSGNEKLSVVIVEKNREISRLNTELRVIQKKKNDEMKRLRAIIVVKDRKISALDQVVSSNTKSVIIAEKKREVSRLVTELGVIQKEKNKGIRDINQECWKLQDKNKKLEAQAAKATIEMKRLRTIIAVNNKEILAINQKWRHKLHANNLVVYIVIGVLIFVTLSWLLW